MDQEEQLKLRLGAGVIVTSITSGLLALGYLTAEQWLPVMQAVVKAMFA